MDLPFIPENGATSSIKPCQTEEGGSFMPRKPKTREQTHTPPPPHTQTHRWRAHLCRCLLPLSPDERERERERAGARQRFAPLKPHRQRLSLRCLSSCHFAGGPAGIPTPPHLSLIAYPPPLPAPHACYFHHFYAFVSLPCLYHFSSPCPLFPVCTYLS